jgi:hypothetical protein
MQSVEAIFQEPLDPLPYVLLGQVDQAGDFDEWEPVSHFKDRAPSPCQAQRGRGGSQALFQMTPFFGR